MITSNDDDIEILEEELEGHEDEIRSYVSPLRHYYDTQVSVEKLRISLGNRISALKRGTDGAVNPIPDIYEQLYQSTITMEDIIDKSLAQELKEWAVYTHWLSHVKGIGPSLAAQMLSLLHRPSAQKGPSSWYKAAGLIAEPRPDGQNRLPRPRKVRCFKCQSTTFKIINKVRTCTECGYELAPGEGKVSYHPWLRRCLYNVATSFVRLGGYYRDVYDNCKRQVIAVHGNDPDNWPPIRIDAAARWRMMKIFLSHLWEEWCEADGIHNRGPYGITILSDGTKVIRIRHEDGSTQDHAYIAPPTWDGKVKI